MGNVLYNDMDENDFRGLFNQRIVEVSGAHLRSLNLTDIAFKSAILTECKFSNCNLSNIKCVNSVFREVEFEGCNLMGIHWTEAKKGATYTFTDCKLDYSSFQGLDLRNTVFKNCSLREVDFAEANLTKAVLSESRLSGASFRNSNLEKADLRGAKEYFIDPRFAKIKEAKFSFPEALVLIEAFGATVEM